MTVDLTGRVAMVTGGGRGLGRAHVRALAARGAAVVINDLGVALDGTGENPSPAEQLAEEIRKAGGRAVADGSDIATEAGGAITVQRAVNEFGRIDILVNNAGILCDRSAHKMSIADAEAVLRVHLLGAFCTTLLAFARMRAQGYGRIVQTTSASGLFGNFGQANYGAAKTGLTGLTKVIAIEGQDKNVYCNAISPCATTRMTEAGFGEMARLFEPELVSPLVVYLASETCRVTGEIFSVGGGQIARIFVGLTEGVFRKDRGLTPEEIDASLEAIMDTTDFSIPKTLEDEWVKMLRQHGLEPTATK
jgi:NAD(P)-dependent dehydrogenase (short-subunit alcohol dehydrogenase family)